MRYKKRKTWETKVPLGFITPLVLEAVNDFRPCVVDRTIGRRTIVGGEAVRRTIDCPSSIHPVLGPQKKIVDHVKSCSQGILP